MNATRDDVIKGLIELDENEMESWKLTEKEKKVVIWGEGFWRRLLWVCS